MSQYSAIVLYVQYHFRQINYLQICHSSIYVSRQKVQVAVSLALETLSDTVL